jgi:hypothetical protein
MVVRPKHIAKNLNKIVNVGAVSPQLILGCRWYALLLERSVNTQLSLCGAGSGALDVTDRRLIAMAGRLVVEIG